jgi:hypothetical protein
MAGFDGMAVVTANGSEDGLWQPFAFVTVTVKLPTELTLMLCVVCPLDQLYELKPAGAESVTLPVPHNAPPPVEVMVGLTGAAFTVNMKGSDAGLVQLPSPTVAV